MTPCRPSTSFRELLKGVKSLWVLAGSCRINKGLATFFEQVFTHNYAKVRGVIMTACENEHNERVSETRLVSKKETIKTFEIFATAFDVFTAIEIISAELQLTAGPEGPSYVLLPASSWRFFHRRCSRQQMQHH